MIIVTYEYTCDRCGAKDVIDFVPPRNGLSQGQQRSGSRHVYFMPLGWGRHRQRKTQPAARSEQSTDGRRQQYTAGYHDFCPACVVAGVPKATEIA